ncbi:hypothetical protein EYF80_005663 [Liparis tanakae]|uniref:Uncharacterized protein n=1 Tax=Liparis tanakae TaxID=230148 RepID=A0A4Z2J209_9TELE|nr:hypothetical protein EYF80_005663 [Liparis tanakae]
MPRLSKNAPRFAVFVMPARRECASILQKAIETFVMLYLPSIPLTRAQLYGPGLQSPAEIGSEKKLCRARSSLPPSRAHLGRVWFCPLWAVARLESELEEFLVNPLAVMAVATSERLKRSILLSGRMSWRLNVVPICYGSSSREWEV